MFEITVTTDVKNNSVSGIKEHVKHDPKINHSNKDIDFNITKYNKHFDYKKGLTEHELLEHDFLNQLNDMNNRNIEKHPDRVKNFDEYINGMKGVPFKTMVVTVGNKDDFKNVDFSESKTSEAMDRVFNLFAEKFNKKFGNHMTIVEQTTNLDESTPHSHMSLYVHGKVGKREKHSTSLNANLKEAYKEIESKEPPKDTRKLMSWWRDQTDTLVIECIQEKYDSNIDLVRTGNHVASFDAYKEIMQRNEAAKVKNKQDHNKLLDEEERLVKFSSSLNIRRSEINKKAQDVEDEVNSSKDDLINAIAEEDPQKRFMLSTIDNDEDSEDEYDSYEIGGYSEPVSTAKGRSQFHKLRFKRLNSILKIVINKSLKLLKGAKNSLKSEIKYLKDSKINLESKNEILKQEQERISRESKTYEPTVKLSTAMALLARYYSFVNSTKSEDTIKKQKFEKLFTENVFNDESQIENNIKDLDSQNGKRIKNQDGFSYNQTAFGIIDANVKPGKYDLSNKDNEYER